MAKAVRKPVGNFFIKKSLQLGLIIKILTVSFISSVVSIATLLFVYYHKYNATLIYLWDQNTNGLDRKESIMLLVLPTLLISATVCILLSFGIGLYASRKYAVPVFKIEQWASKLLNGNLTARLGFREKEEMKELSDKCNEVGDMFREAMAGIRKDVKALQSAGVKNPEVAMLAARLNKLELGD